jgi:hypothetical protein
MEQKGYTSRLHLRRPTIAELAADFGREIKGTLWCAFDALRSIQRKDVCIKGPSAGKGAGSERLGMFKSGFKGF